VPTIADEHMFSPVVWSAMFVRAIAGGALAEDGTRATITQNPPDPNRVVTSSPMLTPTNPEPATLLLAARLKQPA